MAHQLEQLLTCCICLDRFRNPKLLPCQHSVCMEPCMEGLVDYVRRQVKCPECRAEHRIPYNGVQGFPTNVTLQRFLEAHIEITGEAPDPYTGQFMERCSVCNEKSYLSTCAHCDKKICSDCKSAHAEILKREIGRINNQVKRASHRLTDQLATLERNITSLKQNTGSVREEIENISSRLQKAVRDRCDFLKSEVENYFNTESRNMSLLKESLDQEISNIDANIELAEKHMDDNTPWDDCELMDTKEIFLRTMEFIRSFDYEPVDYNRRARFVAPDELNKLVTNLSTLGELVITSSKQGNEGYSSGASFGQGIMRSKSDHRLAVQFRDQEESGVGFSSGRTSPLMRRRFGERSQVSDRNEDSVYESSTDTGRRRFKSRFMRRDDEEERSVRFSDEEPRQRQHVIDTEDVSRGPLSGITRMYDSPRVMQRLLETKKRKDEPPKPTQGTKSIVPSLQRKTSRQTSNEDEIDKLKKQNKSLDNPPVSSASTSRPAVERVSSLRDEDRQNRSDRTSTSPRSSAQHSPQSSISRDDQSNSNANGGTTPSRTSSVEATVTVTSKSYPFSRSSSTSSVGDNNKNENRNSRSLDMGNIEKRLSRSNSTDSNKSCDGTTSPKKTTGAAFSTDELKSRFVKPNDTKSSSTLDTSRSSASRYQSRFLGRAGTPSADASKESGNEDESSNESESEDSDESSEEEEGKDRGFIHSDVRLLLGRSAENREPSNSSSYKSGSTWSNSNGTDSGYGSRYGSTNDNSASGLNRYGTSTSTASDTSSHRRVSYLENKQNKEKDDDFESKYPYASKYLSRNRSSLEEEPKTTFHSRFLNRSKSSAVLGPDVGDDDSSTTTDTSTMGAGRARFEELKEKRQRLAKSKSSAGMDDDEASSTATETTSSPSSYRSRYSRDSDTSTPTSSISRTTANEDAGTSGSSSSQLSNWARYLKNKYGNKSTGSTTPSTTTTAGVSGTSTSSTSGVSGTSSSLLSRASALSPSRAISRSRSSHLLGLAKEGDSSLDDDSKNALATPTSPPAGTLAHTHFGSFHRSQYLQKQRLSFKIGSRGSDPGNFTWPRGIAVGPDNSIVVADSSNHRVQVFDQNGNFIKEFGSYGSGEGEFDCLAGVVVNRIGQYIIADRYNHRIQIFDPSGMFIRTFGFQGGGDRRFSYPWGVATDSLGFIYVCDKENHRVQVFQSDGTFVGKFGSPGSKPGQLEHPHYIAVSSTNRVIVSDSNNHRLQVFDINGKVMTTFGQEGSGDGQFKFPRGVAVDDQGYIFVADSGNNRIQIFHPDGTFLRAFGCWGSGDGEFKGLEGVAVMSNGNILVCDRENHRVQVF